MKKKAIEKIPYLTLQKVSRKHGVKYVGVTAFKIIAQERHLLLEVYKNSKKTKDVPLVRIVITKKDFGNYFPEKDEWTRQKIETDHYYNQGLLWSEPEDRSISWEQAVKRNVLMSQNDLDRIKKVCNKKIWNEAKWWEYIYQHENDLVTKARREAENRRYEKRQQALNDRIANTQKLPEKKILERADKIYFLNKHYLYYKKTGCWVKIACSKCGGVSDRRWKDGTSYESQFQKWIEEPREGKYGICPMCGARGEYKCQGKVKNGHSKSVHMFLGQKYKETGMVLRYIKVEKIWHLGFICGEKGMEMYNASEELSGVEIARAYFSLGEKTQIDYHKHDPYVGKDFWDDCNLYGLSNISIHSAPIMIETYKEMKGTMFQYSALEEYVQQAKTVNPIDYFERYIETPQIEMLVKLGLTGVVNELLRYRYGIVMNEYAKRPDKFLGIRKERVRQLIEKKGDIELLEVMQTEYRLGEEWKYEQLEHLKETGLRRGQIEVATEYMSIQQLLNRISKYAECEYDTGCSSAIERIKQTATIYTDYLSMRIALGYDLHNTVFQNPRDLRNAHEKMVTESNKKKAEKRLAEVRIRFPNIRNNYRKLRKRFFYEDERFLIRPARSAEEIVIEGRTLHHCVGGDNYLEKHNEGNTYILMLRQQEDKETPYITVEIGAKNQKILQWYGAHDKKPDEKNVQKWLDRYIKRLKCGDLAAGVGIEQQEEKQLLQVAI